MKKTRLIFLIFLLITALSSSLCYSQQSHPYDTDQDWKIGDFELLDAIDAWAAGGMDDFALLDLIDYWAAGSYCWDAREGTYKMDNCESGPPPDPSEVAPDIDQTVISTVYDTTAFLYAGDQKVQTGVAPGTIVEKRTAVLRGKVLDRRDNPLSGVKISIKDHPELGQTLSREDGMFDMVVNGGGLLTVDYSKEGFLPAQRQVDVPWQNYTWLPEVILIPLDPKVTSINLTGSEPMQVAQGSVESDHNGVRQNTLLFPQGINAEMVMPDGSTQALTSLSVRATEYTVGENGPKAMPAELPPGTGYTYAVELSVDEAVAAGANEVRFDRPLYNYVDNFLGFPTGWDVPAFYYDMERGTWVPSPSGLVIEILSVTEGKADLDTDGDGAADDAAALGALEITDAERGQLAVLYTPGQSLWRVQLTHFSPHDYNLSYKNYDQGDYPGTASTTTDSGTNNPCEGAGSIIECQNQTLGERIPIVGTPFTLNYRSSRTEGRVSGRTLDIKVSGDAVPDKDTFTSIELEIFIAGQRHTRTFPPEPNQSYSFKWDGMDVYGRELQGLQHVYVSIGYKYRSQRCNTSGECIIIPGMYDMFRSTWNGNLGTWDALPQGLGGWTMNVNHKYNINKQMFHGGNGSQRKAQSDIATGVITTVAGRAFKGYWGDGGPAAKALLYHPSGIAIAPDGGIYIADSGNHVIRYVSPDGVITTFAGNGTPGSSGDGGPALDAQIRTPIDVQLGPDGGVYILQTTGGYEVYIRKVDSSGIITTVAGNGESCWAHFNGSDPIDLTLCGLGGQAVDSSLLEGIIRGRLSVADDGTIYVASHNAILRIGTNGIIENVAGSWQYIGVSEDDIPVESARFWLPSHAVSDSQGNLLVADVWNNRIRRIGLDGIVDTVAGTGKCSYEDIADGVLAINSEVCFHKGYNNSLQVGPDGSIYFLNSTVVRKIDPQGYMFTVAGINNLKSCDIRNPLSPDGTLAKLECLWGLTYAAIGPDDALYIVQSGTVNAVRRISSGTQTAYDQHSQQYLLPSPDGKEIYVFSSTGRHLKTLNSLTGAEVYNFTYDNNGLLTHIRDGHNNVTTIERDASGRPSAIVAPYGQRTTLGLDTNGYLSAITNPEGETVRFIYTPDGLMTEMITPNNDSYKFTYDDEGRLTRDEDPAKGFQTFERTDLENGFEVRHTTALGRVTTYRVESLPTGVQRAFNVLPNGYWNEVLINPDGSSTISTSAGTLVSIKHGPDPRFGMLAPVLETFIISTPGEITHSRTFERTVALSDPDNLLSLQNIQTTMTVNGRIFTYDYDASTRLFTETTPESRQTTSVTDLPGRVTNVNLGAGIEDMIMNYDPRGRLIHAAQGAQSWTFDYDALSRVTSRTDAEGETTLFAYDNADRIIRVTQPGDEIIGYTYDDNGNTTEVVMPDAEVHALEYTAIDLQSGYSPPGNPAYRRNYDLDRYLTSHTLPGGRVVTNSFDAEGRWTGIIYPEAGVNFNYLPTADRLASVTRTDSEGGNVQSVSYSYDGSLVTGVTFSGAADGNYQYTYDNNFFLTQMTLNSGSDNVATPFTWDDDGLQTGHGSFNFNHGGPGGATSEISDGVMVATIDYDTLGRVDSRSHAVNGSSIYDIQLIRNNAGRITRKVETTAGVNNIYDYTYDPNGQLISVVLDEIKIENYTYDENANRLTTSSASAEYDPQDRIVSFDGTAYDVNVDGDLAQRGTDTFQYSARGELLGVSLGDGSNITYSYDGLSRRVGRTDASGSYQYLYGLPGNPFLMTAMRDPEGILTVFFYNEEGFLFSLERDGSRYYVACDQVGTPRIVADAAGSIVKVLEYDSFGNLIHDSNPDFDLPIGFAGGLADAATGLVRFGYRDYEQATGRWTARDPILYNGGQVNLYVYVGNDPAGSRDPLGLWCIGASGYGGVGGGAELCCSKGQCSICGEIGFGFGIGAGLGLGTGDAKATGSKVVGEIGAGCGPIGAGGKCELDSICGFNCDLKGNIGLLQVTGKAGVQGLKKGIGFTSLDKLTVTNCSFQGKLAAEVCGQF